ncbi:MAG: cell division protein FtsA [Fibrobacter sp.]|jgi:cell division protein FtsA|uniref:cell division protein FtsA n=1 Tax=unclassified Fibrobacter TaxID=2634177 RepID=UPI00091D3B31|nr:MULTISPECIES: cell division protein FtsA [unclassified Fibrobacter]MBO6135661.1 cell division protein FtsA [Fibrobacter sp.]MBQ3721633.1 cell division protein FtsA [Fibrobacter sp.]MBR2057690.1 cell division protein FtsA [Fibrobacter sp.]MBR2306638.1 cell division protein FtsA [Fibrobacter sp.]MBR4006266.1 cell division protein FtsA [Fibrobacter sp.]
MDEPKNEIRKEDLLFGLDIGASKINLFVGVANGSSVRVLECGDFPLKNADEFDNVVETLKKAAQTLESTAGVDVHDVYVGIAGKHVSSFNYRGLITLPTGEVRSQDIETVKDQASTIPENAGQIIHVFPGEYTLDDQPGIRNPKGLNGRRLGVEVQVVTSRLNAIQNLDKCVRSAGLHTVEFVLEPLAAAYAVLTPDEKELGVALVDIGAGSADIAVFVGESVRYTASLDLAGNKITSDISKCLKVPISLSKAEEIKKKYGTCKLNNLLEDETFPVPGVGDRGDVQCSRELLARVITARVAEIFKIIKDNLETHKIDGLINGGIVLTGGCCALEGIDEIAEKVFKKPVRIGYPKGTSGIQEAFHKPSYATGIGLLHYAARQQSVNKKHDTGAQLTVSVKKGIQWFKDMVRTYF